jgi:hypothetical protein
MRSFVKVTTFVLDIDKVIHKKNTLRRQMAGDYFFAGEKESAFSTEAVGKIPFPNVVGTFFWTTFAL